MLKDKLKSSNENHWKMNIIYLFLIISNILLFIGLIRYYSNFSIHFSFESFEDISAIIAAMCILGYVSSKLPGIKDLGESSLFGIMFFIIMCLVGVMTSYFTGKLNAAEHVGQYLEMFKILCAVLIFILLATNLKAFKDILDGKFTRKDQIICLIVFILIGLFASYAVVTINGTPANIRCLVVMISGLFGGPVVGIPVGIISGAYRYTLGGATALPCAISTVISGIVGSLIFIWNDKKFPRTWEAIILMFLFTGFEMLMVVIATPSDISFTFIHNIYSIMAFASVVGILLFSIVIKEARRNMSPQLSPEEQKIKEFECELEEYDARIEELKTEIEELKKEKDSYRHRK